MAIRVDGLTQADNIQNARNKQAEIKDIQNMKIAAWTRNAGGVGSRLYGTKGSSNVSLNSDMANFDRYYQDAYGRSLFDEGKTNSRMFNQLMIMDSNTLQQLQVFIGGRLLLVPGEMPAMMEKMYPRETEYMRSLFLSRVLGVNGFGERRLETATVTAMTEQNTFEVVTKQTGASRSINVTFMPLTKGLPEYRYITTWMQMIYNAGSSAAIYPYYTGLEYHEGNHTMNAIYIVPNPSFEFVEDAVLLYAMLPKGNGANNILDQTWSNHNVQEYTIEFKVHMLPGGMPQVLKIAQAVLTDYVAEVTLNDYLVEPANAIGDQHHTMGLGSELVGSHGRAEMDYFDNVVYK